MHYKLRHLPFIGSEGLMATKSPTMRMINTVQYHVIMVCRVRGTVIIIFYALNRARSCWLLCKIMGVIEIFSSSHQCNNSKHVICNISPALFQVSTFIAICGITSISLISHMCLSALGSEVHLLCFVPDSLYSLYIKNSRISCECI